MRERGVCAVVLDHDYFHFASAPEWLEAKIDGDIGDHFYPCWRQARVCGFSRPEWFINGPSAFAFPELAARENGQSLRRAAYAALSRLYREGVGARVGEISAFRRFLEGSDPLARGIKSALRGALNMVGAAVGRPAALTSAAGTHAAAFPPSDAELALAALPRSVPRAALRAALEPFDVVIGYALGARFPAALGMPRFVSLELGTLRGLPFEDSELGRLCAWLYRSSPEVFVTNTDCIASALRLGIAPERITPVPHPFDLDRALSFAAAHVPSPLGGQVPYFLCPARHHWSKGNASWLKGNDVLIRGAAEAARSGARFRLVMVEWGQELELSRTLIAECGLADRVEWIRPMPRMALWPIVRGAAAVLDQFAASAFGGVGLEAMALGRPVISRIAEAELGSFFATPPPILHAATPAEVARAMLDVLEDPVDARGIGRAGQDWMRAEHGPERQLIPQFAACARLLERFGPAEGER